MNDIETSVNAAGAPPYLPCEGQWSVVSQTVRGSSHERSGLPNQDAIGHLNDMADGQPYTILVVSDGHGSSKYFRSDVGARLAVNVAISVMSDYIKSGEDTSSCSDGSISKKLCSAWKDAVADHVENNPLTQDELGTLVQKEGLSANELVEKEPVIAYGATVLAVAAVGTSTDLPATRGWRYSLCRSIWRHSSRAP